MTTLTEQLVKEKGKNANLQQITKLNFWGMQLSDVKFCLILSETK